MRTISLNWLLAGILLLSVGVLAFPRFPDLDWDWLRDKRLPNVLYSIMAGGIVIQQQQQELGLDGFALPIEYVVEQNKMKWISLSAWNEDIEYTGLTGANFPKRYKLWRIRSGDPDDTVGSSAFDAWFVDSLPTDGDLYDDGTLVTSPGSIAGPDSLVYKPDTSFTGTDSFTYHASGPSGFTTTETVSLTISTASSYPLPLGFPTPWGLDLDPPADPAGWPSTEESGFYYVDSDDSNCSTSVTFGTPDVPRCEFPPHNTNVPAGGKIILAPSSVSYRLTNAGSHRLTLDGTVADPTWLIGDESAPVKPLVTTAIGRSAITLLGFNGSYMVASGIAFENVHLDHRMDKDDSILDDHTAFRHIEIKNSTATGGSAISIPGGGGAGNTTDSLYYAMSIHDNGFRDPTVFDEHDIHAMSWSQCTTCMVLDVVAYGNAGDTYQNTQNNDNIDIYIGRLVGHSEGENCVDIKAQDGVWVMDSDCWDLRTVQYGGGSGGNAQGIYQNDDDAVQQVGNVIFLNNRVWDLNGPGIASNIQGGEQWIVGNRVFNNLGTGGGAGMRIESPGIVHAHFNSFKNVTRGIDLQQVPSSVRVVANVVDGATFNVWTLNIDQSLLFDHNFYTEPFATLEFQCCSNMSPVTITGMTNWRTVSSADANSEADTVTNWRLNSLGDFIIQSGTSDLVDRFTEAQLSSLMPGIADMLTILGTSFEDYNGTVRPQNTDYDAGADER